jgi:hypothetical protein
MSCFLARLRKGTSENCTRPAAFRGWARGSEPGASPAPEAPCKGDPAHGQLDFWVGRWEVFDPKGKKDGDNLIEKILASCAIVRTGPRPTEQGKSLFYYLRPQRRWKQVWVTDTGFVKEKTQPLDYSGPGVRSQGELPLPGGVVVLDRTTLTELPEGRVRQVIEQSRDGGKTWSSWEGIYVPARKPGD